MKETDNNSIERLVRQPVMLSITGVSRTTAHRLIKTDPDFPKPVRLTDSSARNAPIAFVLSECLSWINSRIEAREKNHEEHN